MGRRRIYPEKPISKINSKYSFSFINEIKRSFDYDILAFPHNQGDELETQKERNLFAKIDNKIYENHRKGKETYLNFKEFKQYIKLRCKNLKLDDYQLDRAIFLFVDDLWRKQRRWKNKDVFLYSDATNTKTKQVKK